MAEGIKNKNAKFDRVFSDVIRKNGRASEFLLISKYSLSEPGMIKQAPFGLSLIARGKLPLSIDKMEDAGELKTIFELVEKPQEPYEKRENKEHENKEKEPGEVEKENADGGAEK